MTAARAFTSTTAILALLVLSACNDLSEFHTDDDEAFQGKIVGSDADNQQDSFIRSGFPSHLTMSLSFDPWETDTSPGKITLTDKGGESIWFSKTRLESIRPLMRDPLSQYTFPGAGRVRNYIFSARISGQPRSASVFISLMEDKEIEARVIAPGVPSEDGNGYESVDDVALEPLFGVFRLTKVQLR
jgi:hypothetical protein